MEFDFIDEERKEIKRTFEFNAERSKSKFALAPMKLEILGSLFCKAKSTVILHCHKIKSETIRTKLLLYTNSFTGLEELDNCVREFGDGKSYGCRFYIYKIKNMLSERVSEIMQFVLLVLEPEEESSDFEDKTSLGDALL